MTPPSSRQLLERGNNLALDELAVRAIDALAREGVPNILLRGPVLERWLYPQGQGRPYHDVDLLVPPWGFASAERALARLGLRQQPLEATIAGDRPRHADTWLRPATGLMVDLHRSVYGSRASAESLWTALWSATETMRLLGRDTVIPTAPARALLLALHAAQHGVAGTATVVELERAVRSVPSSVWREAFDLARRIRAEPAFAAGLELGEAGAALAESLGVDRERTVDAALRVASAPELSLALEWLRQQRDVRVASRVLARKLFPDPAFMRAWSPDARRGGAYLALAYARRILSLAVQLPGAARAWRAAAAAAKR